MIDTALIYSVSDFKKSAKMVTNFIYLVTFSL